MTPWDTRATKELVDSYYRRDLLTDAQVAELEELADRGAPELALDLLADIEPDAR
jgi:hypothetical protein